MSRLQKGVNDLKTWCLSNGEFGLQLMNEWTGEFDGKKNVNLEDVTKASNKKAKWRCSNGHKWFVTINSRTSRKTGCPYCSGQRVSEENNLKTWCLSNGSFGEQLISEWTGEVFDENNIQIEDEQFINIEDITKASNKKVKWKCSQGHEWFAKINNRTSLKQGCPYCAYASEENSLKTWCLSNGLSGQQLMSEWTGEVKDEKNASIDEVSFGSNKKAKWRCSKGHEWFAMINDRTSHKQGCPYCAKEIHGEKVAKAKLSEENSLKTWCLSNGSFGEQLMSEWTGEVEDKKGVNLEDVARATPKKAKWKCKNGHSWFATIAQRTSQKTGCPFCSVSGTSYPEQFIYHSLKQLYPNTENRCKVLKSPTNPQGIEFDIGVPELKLCIEYSPTYWHQGREEMDDYKKQICEQFNVRLIQIVEDSFNELDFAMAPDYICFKMNNNQRDEILETIVDHILKSLGHSISEIDIEKAKKEAYESSKGIENDMQDTD
ncbi:MAG: zinc-ribbon domain-containing protein [Oscillospiraceae bacterium]